MRRSCERHKTLTILPASAARQPWIAPLSRVEDDSKSRFRTGCKPGSGVVRCSELPGGQLRGVLNWTAGEIITFEARPKREQCFVDDASIRVQMIWREKWSSL